MTHFTKDWPGVQGTVTASSTLMGYVTQKEIEELLQFPNCVGIRVYNIQIKGTDPIDDQKIMLCAVDEEGNEISKDQNGDDVHGSHFLVHIPSERNVSTVERFKRSTALVFGKKTNFDTRFVSFFSVKMLKDQMNDDNFSGIAFYNSNVTLEKIDKKRKFQSHLAAAARIESGVVDSKRTKVGIQGVISDLPCPGHCVDFEHDQITRKPEPSVEGFSTDGIYIIDWRTFA